MRDHPIKPLEIFSELYIGDYFTDTLDFSARQHAAFRLLLLHAWLNGVTHSNDLAAIAQLNPEDWRAVSATIMPLLLNATLNIETWKVALRAYDGQRLPPSDWHIVRSIVLERDGYICQYCSCDKRLHVDHKVPLARGGSNAFDNLVTSCGPCNQSKGPKLLGDWRPPAADQLIKPNR